MTNTALILGATGKFGGHCARAFETAGWQVKRFRRDTQNMNDAARGVDVIVNGLNPPNYKNWATVLPAITTQVISAAKASGATILQPGNVYNFGKQSGPWGVSTPHVTHTVKGQIRIDIETKLRKAAETMGVQTIILRAGDFIDDTNSGNWFDISLTAKLQKNQFGHPGNMNIDHAWAFLPDLARAAVLLAENRAALAMFEDVPFAGHNLTGTAIMKGFEQILGQTLTHKPFPWQLIRLASPFWSLGKELLEMRYLWETPHSLDNTRLRALLPDFEITDTQEMLAASIRWKMAQLPGNAALVMT